jgi:hypothetical protein
MKKKQIQSCFKNDLSETPSRERLYFENGVWAGAGRFQNTGALLREFR